MIKDTHELQGFGMPKMPKFKGHVKLTLYDHKTGKKEVSEGENIVTNAVSDIMSANYLGAIDYSKLFGTDGLWKTWFGGVLVFESAHANLDADKYFPPSYSSNALIAHAGQTSIDEAHDDDSTRGNPVPADYTESENTKKIVWEWGRNKGNGTIRSLSLCHTDVGSYGLGSETYGFLNNFDPFLNITNSNVPNVTYGVASSDNLFCQYDENHGLWFAIGEDGDYTPTNNHTRFATNKLTVYIRRFPYQKAGLFETFNVRSAYQRKFTVTFSNDFKITDDDKSLLYCQPSYYFDYTQKRLWIFSNAIAVDVGYSVAENSYSKKYVKYAIIDCRDGISDNARILTEGLLESDTSDLAPIPFDMNDGYCTNCPFNFNILVDGTYVWLPTSGGVNWNSGYYDINVKGLKKIWISDSVNLSDISFKENIKKALGMSLQTGDLQIVTGGFGNDNSTRIEVVNSGYGYKCQNANAYAVGTNSYGFRTFSSNNKPVVFSAGTGTRGDSSIQRFVFANKMLLTTKFNLDQAVQKTANKSMTVEYTLTEVSS